MTDVTTLNMSGTPKDRLYYILKPVYAEASTVYIPVDNHKVSLRSAVSEAEAHALIEIIPSLDLIWVENEKVPLRRTGDCSRNKKRRGTSLYHGRNRETDNIIAHRKPFQTCLMQ